MRDYIYVYMKEPEVHVLGPGVRYVLWVQGCKQACVGCIAENSKRMEEGTPIPIAALATEIVLSRAEGITISGGEPFLQAYELSELLRRIKSKRDLGVIVYSGYRYEELVKNAAARELLAQTDLLIDGPYIRELDDGKGLRGSSNQRFVFITERYKKLEESLKNDGRENETFYHGIHIHKIGIPNNKTQEE